MYEFKAGPGKLKCQDDGRCTGYSDDPSFDCGNEIETASETFGSLHTLSGGDDTVFSLYGFEGIEARWPIDIPSSCHLECSGCTFQRNPQEVVL